MKKRPPSFGVREVVRLNGVPAGGTEMRTLYPIDLFCTSKSLIGDLLEGTPGPHQMDQLLQSDSESR
jgi:hypothetical protein